MNDAATYPRAPRESHPVEVEEQDKKSQLAHPVAKENAGNRIRGSPLIPVVLDKTSGRTLGRALPSQTLAPLDGPG